MQVHCHVLSAHHLHILPQLLLGFYDCNLGFGEDSLFSLRFRNACFVFSGGSEGDISGDSLCEVIRAALVPLLTHQLSSHPSPFVIEHVY